MFVVAGLRENILSSVPSTTQNSNTTHFVTLPSDISTMDEDGVTSYQTSSGQTIRIVKKETTINKLSSGKKTSIILVEFN